MVGVPTSAEYSLYSADADRTTESSEPSQKQEAQDRISAILGWTFGPVFRLVDATESPVAHEYYIAAFGTVKRLVGIIPRPRGITCAVLGTLTHV